MTTPTPRRHTEYTDKLRYLLELVSRVGRIAWEDPGPAPRDGLPPTRIYQARRDDAAVGNAIRAVTATKHSPRTEPKPKDARPKPPLLLTNMQELTLGKRTKVSSRRETKRTVQASLRSAANRIPGVDLEETSTLAQIRAAMRKLNPAKMGERAALHALEGLMILSTDARAPGGIRVLYPQSRPEYRVYIPGSPPTQLTLRRTGLIILADNVDRRDIVHEKDRQPRSDKRRTADAHGSTPSIKPFFTRGAVHYYYETEWQAAAEAQTNAATRGLN